MTTRWRVCLALAGGFLTATALVGCEAYPTVLVSPLPSSAPVFQSEDEALAAATATYEGYARSIDLLANDDEGAEEEILLFATREAAASDVETFEGIRASGQSLQGSTKPYNFLLAESDLVSGEVHLYVCLDIAEMRLIDENGVDVTPNTRGNHQPFEATLAISDGKLLVERNQAWGGTNFC
ncbi:hypothetical protein [Herbiconiux sp. L3-i23]|uniref:hypothetical protein n=1 Tax=Herbiconiux sp. L3-i23 TaxID=2905871 RepID=UPI0020698AF7|nr:hypothetical protein [Herbiconiux sp. L3-i23]BDI23391.1 hypothetical protein L3i23_21670 [Herbiconiux sp. L3-i23]